MDKIKNKRKCIVTNKRLSKDEMIRVVMKKDGSFSVDSDEKGRGAYISKDIELVVMLRKTKALNRSFKTQVPIEVYTQLIDKMEDYEYEQK